MADRLALLRDAGIVVLWRPFHEAAGNSTIYSDGKAWFWWGSDGAGPCVSLWHMMYDYFRERGLDNLIWIWTSQTKDAAWYPGDDYVDMIGRDLYNYSVDDASYNFRYLTTYYPHKMVALSECGYSGGTSPYISDQWEAGAKWSFAMPWYHYQFNPGSGGHMYANSDWWQDWFKQDNVLTMDNMKTLRAEYLNNPESGIDHIAPDQPEADGNLDPQAVSDASAASDAWFTLEGLPIPAPTRPGLYIHNSRKILIK